MSVDLSEPVPAAQSPRGGALPAVLEGVAKRFGRRWVLRGVDLQIGVGEVVALFGRNGSGKTTLLRVLATLTRPTRGGGRIFGHDLAQEGNAVRASTGMLGHASGVYPDLTARENLRFAMRMLGLIVEKTRIDALLERVGLLDDADLRARDYSVGMQRRLALARLWLRPPRLLLLDEPHAAFDSDGIRLVHELVREVGDHPGATLIATHDVDRAADLVTRRLRLEAGRLVAIE
ncbi:MAG: heme ABC exporter ATP-binding protein CcmA [Longimicrobiales bacterium]